MTARVRSSATGDGALIRGHDGRGLAGDRANGDPNPWPHAKLHENRSTIGTGQSAATPGPNDTDFAGGDCGGMRGDLGGQRLRRLVGPVRRLRRRVPRPLSTGGRARGDRAAVRHGPIRRGTDSAGGGRSPAAGSRRRRGGPAGAVPDEEGHAGGAASRARRIEASPPPDRVANDAVRPRMVLARRPSGWRSSERSETAGQESSGVRCSFIDRRGASVLLAASDAGRHRRRRAPARDGPGHVAFVRRARPPGRRVEQRRRRADRRQRRR